MVLSDRQLLDALSRMPFVDSAELALILGEPHATVHRALSGLLANGPYIWSRSGAPGLAHEPPARQGWRLFHICRGRPRHTPPAGARALQPLLLLLRPRDDKATLVFHLGHEPSHAGISNRPCQPPVADHAGNVQRLLHHLARRLGYRRRCLVVTVVPDVDGPGVQPAPFAVQLSLSRAP